MLVGSVGLLTMVNSCTPSKFGSVVFVIHQPIARLTFVNACFIMACHDLVALAWDYIGDWHHMRGTLVRLNLFCRGPVCYYTLFIMILAWCLDSMSEWMSD